jgi:hypothetical protein
MEFRYVPSDNVLDQNDLLQQLVSTLEKANENKSADNLRLYIKDRAAYINTHNGKYVQISKDGIKLLDITEIDSKDLGFNSKYKGLLLKVGNEVSGNTNTLVNWVYNPITNSPTINITIGGDQHPTLVNAIIDTGCMMTSFNLDVLRWAKNIDPYYPLIPSRTTGVGGTFPALQGSMGITYCNRPYTLLVNYMDMVFPGLVGMDILNSGILSLDTGSRGSFTYH